MGHLLPIPVCAPSNDLFFAAPLATSPDKASSSSSSSSLILRFPLNSTRLREQRSPSGQAFPQPASMPSPLRMESPLLPVQSFSGSPLPDPSPTPNESKGSPAHPYAGLLTPLSDPASPLLFRRLSGTLTGGAGSHVCSLPSPASPLSPPTWLARVEISRVLGRQRRIGQTHSLRSCPHSR